MAFNTYTFLAFALVVVPVYYAVPRRGQNAYLLAASYVFYGAWDWRFCGLILASTLVDYIAALRIAGTEDPRRRRAWLAVSCVFNLGMLVLFKYSNFFIENLEDLLGGLGVETAPLRLDIILPVGISFYTFQTLSYTIDVYRRQLAPTRSLPDFALFVAFFPQLVAGPIERATHLLPQIQRRRRIRMKAVRESAWLITLGYFKKVVIADNLATVVNEAFQSTEAPSGLSCLLAVYAFAFQVYCDFSGYSDIARGLAKLFGIELNVNFNLPFRSRNMSELWRRWHISLSTWMRDYLYFPLGGSRGAPYLAYRNLLVTMSLIGLWHGAGWNFVLWGVWNGILLAAHRLWVRHSGPAGEGHRGGDLLRRLATFNLFCSGLLIFRSTSLAQTGTFVERMLTAAGPVADADALLFHLAFYVTPLWIIESYVKNADDPADRPGWDLFGPFIVTGMWIAIILLAPSKATEFIYFQF